MSSYAASPLPATGFLELPQIIGQLPVTPDEAAENKRLRNNGPKRARNGIPALIPISQSGWFAGVQKGIYPAPVKFGNRSLWRVEQIRALIER